MTKTTLIVSFLAVKAITAVFCALALLADMGVL